MFLIYDTETTGLPKDYNAPVEQLDNWPRVVQIAWQLHDAKGKLIEAKSFIVKPEGFSIPYNAEKIHGISNNYANTYGQELKFVLEEFRIALEKAEFIAGHNIEFDNKVMGAEFLRAQLENFVAKKESIDTKDESTDFCALPGGRGGKFKWPKLEELHLKLFNANFEEAHNAIADVVATTRCFLELIRINIITAARLKKDENFSNEFKIANPNTIAAEKLEVISLVEASKKLEESISAKASMDKGTGDEGQGTKEKIEVRPFVHLHVRSQFSVLQSTIDLGSLIKRAKEYNMPAVAVTDNQNMFGMFKFVRDCAGAGIKPIIGCELNVCGDLKDKTKKDNGFQQVFIAKNKAGYLNLSKLSSIGFTEGFYYVPRVDKNEILRLKGDLIATTGGIFGEIPFKILNEGEEAAEEAFVWWKENFGDDFYVELNRHFVPEEKIVNDVLLRFAKKYNVKYFASNNCYYLDKKEANAHDILMCVKDGELQAKPKVYTGKIDRGHRFGLPNDEFYFKSSEEMHELFEDLPEVFDTIDEIVNKIEEIKLKQDILLPEFTVPEGFGTQDEYLRHLTYEGAARLYPEMTDEVKERIEFELETVRSMGFAGYFLIVSDFIAAGRASGVAIGPGRGSAAGSVVAYLTGITSIDPIKYKLLFERFLNPDRKSMPDIDTDFDDEGRDKVIKYVINKYGRNQVAQIITYGTMAAKVSIKDVSRVLDLPLPEANALAKLIPTRPGIELNRMINAPIDGEKSLKTKEGLNNDDLNTVLQLREIAKGNTLQSIIIREALILEGSIRNTGIHAAGVIIAPKDLMEIMPVCSSKDSDLFVTQFDGSIIEDAGVIKMDFLGLKTLTIIRDALALIKKNKNIDIDIDKVPLDDAKTLELYQQGSTTGTFQFESVGMQKYLKELKPDQFEDLIAMNALYRPGPIEYIPSFIKRKHKLEEVSYDLPEMAELLEETYGITVYQEQVMLLSQKLANFTKGDADTLRKAMGKKQIEVLNKMKSKFIDNAVANGHPADKLEKIWTDWEAFASYAFNKSHSTCYAFVAFQTAYLKAHYPAEYMASVLTHNLSNIDNITFFMEECKRMGIPVLGPDVNESDFQFSVNEKNEIRFGMGAIKGVGENAVISIVEERDKAGKFKSVFELVRRINLKTLNKRTFESLVLAGAFDSFGIKRPAYFIEESAGNNFIGKILKYGNSHQDGENSNQQSLFGDSVEVEIAEPAAPQTEDWGTLERLKKEKEVVGFFISGHPLDDFRIELKHICEGTLSELNEVGTGFSSKVFKIGGIISAVEHRTTKTGKPMGFFTVEDYHATTRFVLFDDQYMKLRHMLVENTFVFIHGKMEKRRFGNLDEHEFKISQMEILALVRERLAKWLQIKLDLIDVSEKLIDDIEKLFTEHKGKCRVKFSVSDSSEQIKIDLPSNGNGINVTNELLFALEEMKLGYEILT
jgi:DNA polymerase-3 subunit alpha